MARIGAMRIGGRGAKPGDPVVFSVAFDLTQAPKSGFVYRPDGTSWETEIRAGQRSVVARTTEDLARSALLAAGLEYAQRCLDIVCFETRNDLLLANPGDTHVLVFRRDGQVVLQHVDITTVSLGVGSITAVVRDKAGNIKEQPALPPVWTPGLRFYRLSQGSTDLYEAYRNLFLGLEALLDTICPTRKGEGERKWLLRALSAVSSEAGLRAVVPPGTTDPAAHIVETQWDRIRCRLFHAKPSVAGRPIALPDPEQVTAAYEGLIRIWRQIAQGCLSVRSGGGGAFTYAGFTMMMDAGLSKGVTMYCSEDDTPPAKTDSAISPLGKHVFPFDATTYLGTTAPGRVGLLGSSTMRASGMLPMIHRIGATVAEKMVLIGGITAGVEISGVDVFESLQTAQLRNLGLPRMVFGVDPG